MKQLQKSLRIFVKKGQLDETPRRFVLERAKVGDLPLAFPGKVLADRNSNRLFIADSNHNRIVITDLEGKFIETIGNGEASAKDGSFSQAGFHKPQGMAIDGDILFVADTENHLIRRVDLRNRKVETIGGTGVLSEFTGFGGDGLKTALRSPWDLEKVGKYLYIAMAGSHQIWRLDLERNYLEPYAGNRQESRKDGTIKHSNFAQPSGIVSNGKKLFVADSESNIIREIDFEKEQVSTIVGGDLFQFGDKDGTRDNARLQHPLGVEIYNGKVLIADTYNHKIKSLDVEKGEIKTFLGTGKSGQDDGRKASFYEPGGISVAGDQLFVADTNNHAVRVVNLLTKEVSTLKIEGLKPPESSFVESVSPNLTIANVKEQMVSISKEGSLFIDVKLPSGFHLNPNAPQRYEVTYDNDWVRVDNPKQKFDKLPIEIPFHPLKRGKANLSAKLNIYYCREDNTGVCYIKTLVWNVPLKFVKTRDISNKIRLNASVR